MKRKPSINRIQARELEKKVVPAIKLLSQHMHNTAKETPEKTFFGYKVPAGNFTDNKGVEFQVQIRAYKTKKDFIKKNEIKPILAEGFRAWGFKLRLFLTILITKINKL